MAIPSYPQRPDQAITAGMFETEFDKEEERAEQGDVSAMMNVAKVYYTGWDGVLNAEPAKARKWYAAAAAKGNSEASSWVRRLDEADRPTREKNAASVEEGRERML